METEADAKETPKPRCICGMEMKKAYIKPAMQKWVRKSPA